MKLSVMMITYNHERYLAQALESVLAQRVNFDYEIVVGEDCSTDRTREILMDFHRRNPDKIVPLLRERNVGAMPNAMETLEACRGEYLAIVEGDDYWTCDDKLQRQVDFLDQHPDYTICFHRADIRDETGAGRVGVLPDIHFKAGSYTIEDLIAENFIPTCSVMYRWDSVGPLPDWYCDLKLGDYPLHILAARSGKIKFMDEIMAVYRMHPGGMWTSGQAIDQKYAMLRMMEKLDEHLEFQYTKPIRRMIAGFYAVMAMVKQQEGRRLATGKYLAYSLWNGSWRQRDWHRMLTFLAAYTLMGSWYKVFSRSKRG